MARILGLDGSRIPERGAADLSGVPDEIRLGDVEVRLLLQPEHRAQADRHFDAAFKALEYYGYWYGRYPYATLTVVDPEYGAGGAGGMEYPTFITAGTRYVDPAAKQRPEGVTVHEAGHQFWYGLVANNEFEEAWLDEGINSYATGKVMEKIYGPDRQTMELYGAPYIRYPLMTLPSDPAKDAPTGPADRLERLASLRWAGAGNDSLLNFLRDLPFLTFPRDVALPAAWSRRGRYLVDPSSDVMVRPSWEFLDGASYGRNSYDKAVLSLRTLETVIGEDAVARSLRLFHQKWRFRHPATRDFVEIVNAVTGRDMSWYFDQTLHGSGKLDYAIESVSSRRPAPAGIFGSGAGRREVGRKEAKEAAAGGKRELEVLVKRLGDVRLPVEIELVFENGRRETRSWDGQYRWLRIRESVDDRIVQARLLPAAGRPLDAVWYNDARTAKPSRWPALRWWTRLVGWAQQVLYFYSGIA